MGAQTQRELGAGAVQARLHGAQGQAGDVGDLFVGEVFEVSQNDEAALLFGQGAQVVLEQRRQRTSADPPLGIARFTSASVWIKDTATNDRVVEIGVVAVVPALEKLQAVEGPVAGDPIDPRRQFALAAKARQVMKQGDEDLLREIFRLATIVQQAHSDGKHPVGKQRHERVEGGGVAGSGAAREGFFDAFNDDTAFETSGVCSAGALVGNRQDNRIQARVSALGSCPLSHEVEGSADGHRGADTGAAPLVPADPLRALVGLAPT